jgi:hypothetical protein
MISCIFGINHFWVMLSGPESPTENKGMDFQAKDQKEKAKG